VDKTEMQLVNLASEGDRAAFWQLVEPHLRIVFLTAKSILRNFEDAEEVAQESLLKALRNIRHFRGEASIKTWLVRIAANESLMRIRKYHKNLYSSADEMADGGEYQPKNFADWREIPSEALQRKELQDALRHALASLPPKYREVLTLRDISQLTSRETAKILGLSLPNVKTRLLRARLQMRDLLAPGFDESWFKSQPSERNLHANRTT
jgi:RNA polymerase sigma-70 factor, ECF subfamily